jgi:cystathionine beta-lyase/cystathionine gamma-synthase
VVADRWGEILFLDSPSDPTWRVPDVDELLSWVHFAQIQCPECPP